MNIYKCKDGTFVEFVEGSSGTYAIYWDKNGKYMNNTIPWTMGGGSNGYPDLTKEEMKFAIELNR